MLPFFVSILTFVVAAGAFAQEKERPVERCEDVKIRVMAFSEVKVSREKICYGEEIVNFYSASCRKKKCSAYHVPKRYYIHEFFGDKGTPGFKLCRELGGIPEIVDIFVENEWHKTDRCVFKDGFVDTDSLLDFYIDRDSP